MVVPRHGGVRITISRGAVRASARRAVEARRVLHCRKQAQRGSSEAPEFEHLGHSSWSCWVHILRHGERPWGTVGLADGLCSSKQLQQVFCQAPKLKGLVRRKAGFIFPVREESGESQHAHKLFVGFEARKQNLSALTIFSNAALPFQ